MARGQRKSIEEKIAEKEELILSLQTRIKSEQDELEELYRNKKMKDLESIENIIKSSGLNEYEVTEELETYVSLKNKNVS